MSKFDEYSSNYNYNYAQYYFSQKYFTEFKDYENPVNPYTVNPYTGVAHLNKIERPHPLTIDESNIRYYLTKEANKFPSITTILGETSDKKSLDAWKKRVGSEEADKISKAATDRGTAVHSLIEKLIDNSFLGNMGYLPQYDIFKSEIKLYEINLIETLHRNIQSFIHSEIAFNSNYLGIGGRTDCIAKYKNKYSILDFKTSRKPKKEEWIEDYFLQATGYSIMADEFLNNCTPKYEQLVILIACDNGEVQEFIGHRGDYLKKLCQRINNYIDIKQDLYSKDLLHKGLLFL